MDSQQLARQIAAITRWLRVFHPSGDTVEIRALRLPGKKAVCLASADLDQLARRAAELDGLRAEGTYFTLNPLRPDLAGSIASCKKADVIERHWLPLDIDPLRPRDSSSTEAELAQAWAVLDRVKTLLDLAGLKSPVIGQSGNGWHLCYPILLANDDPAQELIKQVLKGLQARCGDKLTEEEKVALKAGAPLATPKAKVEEDVHDAPRIWKLYGTMARKGTPTADRPHRWARLISGEPWDRDTGLANVEALRELLRGWQWVESVRRGRNPDAAGSNVERARAYVAKMPAAVSGQGGHDTTFEVAQILARGFGLSRSASWPILCEYNARCSPPWSEKELLHKIESAEKDSRLPPGFLGQAAATKPLVKLPAIVIDQPPAAPESQVPAFPVEIYPPWIRRFIEEGARSLCCPPDYLAVPLLAAAATAIGASRSLKLTGDWEVMPSLYACVVAPPGSAKSPAAARVLSPIRYRQVYEKIRYKERLAEWNRTPAEERGDKPVYTRTWASSQTTEKLVALLAESPRGLLYYPDELLAWIGSMDQYREGGKGTDRQTYLTLWDNGAVSVERKSHEDGMPLTVQRPCLTVIGSLQPDVLHRLATNGEQDGFMERLLFSYPEATQERTWSWEGISKDARDSWRSIASRLYSLQMAPPLEEGDDPWPRHLDFDESGRRAWESWYAAHQRVRAELPTAMHATCAKMESYCARFALILKLLWYAHSDDFEPDGVPSVSAAAIHSAAVLVSYFLSHARRAYGCLETSPADKRADRAVEWIRKQGGTVTARDLLHHRVASVRKASEALKLIEELADRGLGTASVERASNGREVVRFQLFGCEQHHTISQNSADSADTVSTGSHGAIFVGTKGLARSVDSADGSRKV